jgi:hypothetical protein
MEYHTSFSDRASSLNTDYICRYPAEIVPLKIRAPTNALATSGNWIFNFMVVMITPVAFETIGYQVSSDISSNGVSGLILTIIDIHYLRCYQRLHLPHRLPLLPRNQVQVSRRDGPDLQENHKRVQRGSHLDQGALHVRQERRQEAGVLGGWHEPQERLGCSAAGGEREEREGSCSRQAGER